jgi:uncharacterized SAM-binding protein YcdF (DUF218 family)
MLFVKKLFTSLLIAPGIFVVLLLLLVLFARKRLRLYLILLAVFLYGLSIGPTKELLLLPLENAYPIPSVEEMKKCDAIVVLGGGAYDNAPDVNGTGGLSGDTLTRSIGAYRAYLITGEPIIISGGSLSGGKAEATVVRRLFLALGVKETHIIAETRSRDTSENAQYSAEICRKRKFERILLVTSAYHMKRAVLLFQRTLPSVVPYPTGFRTSRAGFGTLSLLPDASHLLDVSLALKEYLGIVYYTVVRS